MALIIDLKREMGEAAVSSAVGQLTSMTNRELRDVLSLGDEAISWDASS